MQNVNEIASYSRRLESLHFGVADYAASTKAKTTVIGGIPTNVQPILMGIIQGINIGEIWHHAITKWLLLLGQMALDQLMDHLVI